MTVTVTVTVTDSESDSDRSNCLGLLGTGDVMWRSDTSSKQQLIRRGQGRRWVGALQCDAMRSEAVDEASSNKK